MSMRRALNRFSLTLVKLRGLVLKLLCGLVPGIFVVSHLLAWSITAVADTQPLEVASIYHTCALGSFVFYGAILGWALLMVAQAIGVVDLVSTLKLVWSTAYMHGWEGFKPMNLLMRAQNPYRSNLTTLLKSDIDLLASTDFEDLLVFALDALELIWQDVNLLVDLCGDNVFYLGVGVGFFSASRVLKRVLSNKHLKK